MFHQNKNGLSCLLFSTTKKGAIERGCRQIGASHFFEKFQVLQDTSACPLPKNWALLKIEFLCTAKIMGGGEATPNSIPHQVALVLTGTNNVQCGGTILNRKFVLTAAHCVDPIIIKQPFTISTYQVIAGEHDLSDNNDSATRHDIANVTIHSNWR